MLNFSHDLLVFIHIVLGVIGILLFWAAAFSSKGSSLHRRMGKLFVQITYLIVATALISCVWCLVHPQSFAGTYALTPSQQSELQVFMSLLGVLAIMTWTSAVLGVRSLRTKARPQELLNNTLRFLFALLGISSLALSAHAITRGTAWGMQPIHWASCILGGIFFLNAISEYRYTRNPPDRPRAWLAKHIGCMIGCGIAYHTAMLLAGARRILVDLLPGSLMILPWVLPTMIGLTASALLTRRYVPEASADHEPKLVDTDSNSYTS